MQLVTPGYPRYRGLCDTLCVPVFPSEPNDIVSHEWQDNYMKWYPNDILAPGQLRFRLEIIIFHCVSWWQWVTVDKMTRQLGTQCVSQCAPFIHFIRCPVLLWYDSFLFHCHNWNNNMQHINSTMTYIHDSVLINLIQLCCPNKICHNLVYAYQYSRWYLWLMNYNFMPLNISW